jgi:hypothetical protein
VLGVFFNSLYIFLDVFIIQPTSPIRAEIDVKLGGTQCNIIMSRLKPWLRLHYSKKKRMVLREEMPALEKPRSTESKAIMWTCTVSAPEMTVVLYSISGLPVYHVSDLFTNLSFLQFVLAGKVVEPVVLRWCCVSAC